MGFLNAWWPFEIRMWSSFRFICPVEKIRGRESIHNCEKHWKSICIFVLKTLAGWREIHWKYSSVEEEKRSSWEVAHWVTMGCFEPKFCKIIENYKRNVDEIRPTQLVLLYIKPRCQRGLLASKEIFLSPRLDGKQTQMSWLIPILSRYFSNLRQKKSTVGLWGAFEKIIKLGSKWSAVQAQGASSSSSGKKKCSHKVCRSIEKMSRLRKTHTIMMMVSKDDWSHGSCVM